ncbi:response regulator [Paenibacillus alkalitolerans]|uniref:response regulator n=1 Tax=Paenibacillus alkalitolerans TaxID=2799335 RepID=UPI0018F6C0FC|nr:response regulator [Paenibacillus alkalitolerans]
MNIVIADDEYYARKALAQMIQDWDSSLTVIEARNGEEALARLESGQIDLVFTDIRMPLLDGLQLSSLLYERYPQVTNVIISGYDDFKYAQEAIVYNVKQYLLKPVEKNEIVSVLEQAKTRSKAWSVLQLKEKISSLFHEESDASPEAIGLPPVHSFASAVLQTREDHFTSLDEIVSEVFSDHRFFHFHLKEKRFSRMSIVLLVASDSSVADKLWSNGSLFRQAAKKYSKKTGDELSVGISGIHQQLPALPESYREAKNAILYRILDEGKNVYHYEETKKKFNTRPNMTDDMLHPLYNKIIRNQIAESKAMIDHLFRIVVEHKLSVYTLNDICHKLVTILNTVIESTDRESGKAMSYLEPINLFQFHRLEHVVEYFDNVLVDVAKMVENFKPKADMIHEIKAYVERNYQHNIKLEDIAKNLFYADPSHLSKQFTKRYGISFSQYLISVRLNHARKMLEFGGALSVSEVARAVGFNDYSYFIQMYKKHFGETPGKHKRSLAGE